MGLLFSAHPSPEIIKFVDIIRAGFLEEVNLILKDIFSADAMGKQLEVMKKRLKRSAMVEEAESWDLSTIAMWTIGTIAASVLAIGYTIPPIILTAIGCGLAVSSHRNCHEEPLGALKLVFIPAFFGWPWLLLLNLAGFLPDPLQQPYAHVLEAVLGVLYLTYEQYISVIDMVYILGLI